MKHRIGRNQRKQAAGWFRALAKVGQGKSRADLAIRLSEKECYPLRGHTQGMDSPKPLRRVFIISFLGVFLAVTTLAQSPQNIPDEHP